MLYKRNYLIDVQDPMGRRFLLRFRNRNVTIIEKLQDSLEFKPVSQSKPPEDDPIATPIWLVIP